MRFLDHSSQVLSQLQARREAALRRCGTAAEGYAKAICPVDTGRLRASIRSQVDGIQGRMVLGTNVEYAADVELGTGRYRPGWSGPRKWRWQSRDGRWHTTTGQRPQPYLRPAMSDHTGAYSALIRISLGGE